MRDLYQRVTEKLDEIIWDELWRGFHPYSFALYNEETVYLAEDEIPRDERFLANTAILFDGEWMAIWNTDCDEEEDAEVLAANLAHEMFHCFQQEQGETRYANELAVLAYPLDEQNYQMKARENRRIADMVSETSLEGKYRLFGQVIQSRRNRVEQIKEVFQLEIQIETIEGAAEFVGLRALRQLNETMYEEKLNGYLQELRNVSENLLHIRRSAYYTGTLLLLTLELLGKPIEQDLTKKEPLYRYFEREIPTFPVEYEYQEEVAQLIEAEIERRKNVIHEFLAIHPNEKQENSRMSGYDPMNMFRIDGWIYCTNFVHLTNLETEHKTFFRGPILLKLKKGTFNEVESYYWEGNE